MRPLYLFVSFPTWDVFSSAMLILAYP